MRYLEKYNAYLIEKLLESILVTTKEFKDIIHDMPQGNKIADILYNIIVDKTDIKTNYNLLDSSVDKNDEITFLPDSQYQRFLSKEEDVATKTKSTSSIGRMIRQILKDNEQIYSKDTTTKFTDADIEKFVNSFKTTWNKKHGITNRKIELVKGKNILKWYNVENYNSSNGTLGNSCMRYTTVNHFMNIYAENPEKISMVVLTEDNKLLARALFWNLDETDESKSDRFYLDRIYTEQDSDFDFVYDWVFENLCNRDNRKLLTHKNVDYSDYRMKVFLNKTTFEHYPYADSFLYLYQRIDENAKLTGDGYVSNSRDLSDEITKEFVVSEIRNHRDGYPSRLSHYHSEKLDIYILKHEAIYDNEVGYVPRSMCVKCKYTDEYIYKENAVYSEYMQDWIPKSDAIETEKFGIVHKDSIIRVATEYNGEYDNPIDFLENVDESLFKVEEIIRSEEIDYAHPEYLLGLPFRKFSKELLGKDFWNEWQIKFGCFEFFDCGDYNESIDFLGELSSLCYDYNGRAYFRKEDAELFGYTPNLSKSKLVAFRDLKGRLERISYPKYISTINKSSISQESKDYLLLNADKAHKYLLKNSSTYRLNYQIDQQLGNVSAKDLYFEWFELTWSELMKNEASYNESLKASLEYYDIEFEKVESLVYNVIAGISFFYLYFEDSNESRNYVRDCIDKLPEFKDQLSQLQDGWSYTDSIEVLRGVFREYMMYDQRDIQNEEIGKLANKYNCSGANFKDFIRKKVDVSKINPFV